MTTTHKPLDVEQLKKDGEGITRDGRRVDCISIGYTIIFGIVENVPCAWGYNGEMLLRDNQHSPNAYDDLFNKPAAPAHVAQRSERDTHNVTVEGSIPSGSTVCHFCGKPSDEQGYTEVDGKRVATHWECYKENCKFPNETPFDKKVEKKRWARAVYFNLGRPVLTERIFSSLDEARQAMRMIEYDTISWPCRFDSDGYLILPEEDK